MFSCSPTQVRFDSQRTVLWFLQNRALVLWFMACLFMGSQKQSFFLQTLLFTAFLVTVLKMLTYALVSTWPLVSSGWEHVKRKCTPDPHYHNCFLVFQSVTHFLCEEDIFRQREGLIVKVHLFEPRSMLKECVDGLSQFGIKHLISDS